MNGLQENQQLMSVQNVIVPTGIENVREIPLTPKKRKMVALVDIENYNWLMQWKWSVSEANGTFYAERHENYIKIKMHREILYLTKGDGILVDHKNRNGLDNRKENLRITTRSLNGLNSKIKSNNTSGYRGVSFAKLNKKWRPYLSINKKRIYFGLYLTAKDAAIAYDKKAVEYYGSNAILNFPLKG